MGLAMAKKILALPPGALGRGQKVKYHLYSITKSISNSERLPLGHFHEPTKILYHAIFFFFFRKCHLITSVAYVQYLFYHRSKHNEPNLDLREQSALGTYCLQYTGCQRTIQLTAEVRAENNCREWRERGFNLLGQIKKYVCYG